MSDDADNKNQPQINDQKNATEGKRERFTKKLEGFSSVFEFAVAAAAVVGVILVIIQICYLGKSDRLSREALQLTRENSASSDRTTAEILARMKESNRITREALANSQKLSDAAVKANQLTAERNVAEQARAAATSAREERFFRSTHRARLGAVVMDHIVIEGSGLYTFKITFRNDPASLTAKSVVVRARAETRDADAPLPATLTLDPPTGDYLPVTSIGPGATQFLNYIWSGDDAEIEDIKEQRKQIFFYGKITYTDDFKTNGVLEFCYFYWVPMSAWLVCGGHNIEQ